MVIHNPLHDSESIWWLLLYVFAVREVVGDTGEWDRGIQESLLDLAFPPIPYGGDRRLIFENSEEFASLTGALAKKLRGCHDHLDGLREVLIQTFQRAERELPKLDSSSWAIGSNLHAVFSDTCSALLAMNWPKMKKWKEIDQPDLLKEPKKAKSAPPSLTGTKPPAIITCDQVPRHLPNLRNNYHEQ